MPASGPIKLIDETFTLSRVRGGGKLRFEIWVDETGEVVRYNLAYINHGLCQRDNGRVVGYDNQHGRHHRHYLGGVDEIEFVSFADIEARFEADWTQLAQWRK